MPDEQLSYYHVCIINVKPSEKPRALETLSLASFSSEKECKRCKCRIPLLVPKVVYLGKYSVLWYVIKAIIKVSIGTVPVT